MSRQRRIAVIGSGFAGLSAATFLAREGHHVTVLEKNATAGGRARQFTAGGFTFDMGPSWYWMPDVFDRYFGAFGKKVADYYDLKRLDPSYRVYFSATEHWDVPSMMEGLRKKFESVEPGSGARLDQFISEGKFKYETGIQDLVFKPGRSLFELADMRVLKGIFKLHLLRSMATYIRQYFKDPRLIQLLEFPVLFLGASPENIPALYSLMNYADLALGTWYPMGGMNAIVRGMQRLAEEQGVHFRFSSEVTELKVSGNRITGVVVNGQTESFDYIVGGADYHHIEQKLLPLSHRKYSPAYWDKRVMAPSSLIFYLGISKRLKNLQHHNLFFDKPFAAHSHEIYKEPRWPSDPLFYACVPSLTDPSVAPPGMENVFILIPVAPDLPDNEVTRATYYEKVIGRMEALTGQDIRGSVVYQRSYAHTDFITDYHSFKGNAYGLANTLLQTAHLKPSLVNPRVRNLFYTGQLTVPGPGIPPSLISGEVAARELLKQDRLDS
ncbi:MAG: phytoene desaturase [Cyclobacteriaceae bacterium]|nr:phytoene desaturase [Cyclobacteriaceae bacterium]